MIQNKKTNAFVMNGGESKASDIFEDLFKAGFLSEEEKKKLHDILDPFYQTLYKRGDSEEYWEEVREFWAFKEPPNGVVMMNAANLCPEPEPLIEMANYLRTIYNEDVSMQVRTGRGRYVLGLEKSREIIGKALGLEGEKLKNLAIVRNASEANNTISNAYHNWNPDGTDKVVIWEGNHPTNRDVWHMRSKWDGQKRRKNPLFQIVEVEFGREADADEIADKFIKEIDDNTRFVTFSYISNGSGTRVPEQAIEKIWETIDGDFPDCHLHIDGTMAWGSLPLDFSDPLCHSFSSSSHKWFIGPKETGILYMRPEKAKNFIPSIISYNYKIEFPYWDEWEQEENRIGETAMERFELLGQRDDVNIISLAATQLMWSALSPTRAVKRIGQLASYLKEKLIKSKWEFVTPINDETSWAIIRVEAPRDKSKVKLVDYLYEKGISGAEGGGSPGEETLRLCPTIYNLKKHIDHVVESMNEWKSLKI